MLRRVLAAVLAAVVLSLLGLSARAAEQTGTIRVTLESTDGTPVSGVVTLYRVGEAVSEGYRITEEFGGGIVRQEDALSPHLAWFLAEMEATGGTGRILDESGSAEFSDLEQGLYLLVQREVREGYQAARPYLIALPYEGQWQIQAYPGVKAVETESPKTGQHPAPLLGAMAMVLAGMGLAVCADRKRRK